MLTVKVRVNHAPLVTSGRTLMLVAQEPAPVMGLLYATLIMSCVALRDRYTARYALSSPTAVNETSSELLVPETMAGDGAAILSIIMIVTPVEVTPPFMLYRNEVVPFAAIRFSAPGVEPPPSVKPAPVEKDALPTSAGTKLSCPFSVPLSTAFSE